MTPVLGAIDYLNALPLVEGLERPACRLSWLQPAAAAAALQAGKLDGALVSSIELSRQPDLVIAGRWAVCARGPVQSVLVVSPTPIPALRELHLDPASRTSNVLAQLLLPDVAGPAVTVAQGPPPAKLPDRVGQVVIGDPALRLERQGLHVLDLAEAWRRRTDLPFVFALWGLRRSSASDPLIAALDRAGQAGTSDRALIAEREAPRRGIPADLARTYLTEALHYDLGPREIEGLTRFLVAAHAAGLAPPPPTLQRAAAAAPDGQSDSR